jgi:HNH endonuclease
MTAKRVAIPKGLKNSCWTEYFGEAFAGMCAVGCGKKITVHEYDCGHIKSAAKGGENSITNLKPICGNCNKSMGTRNMVEYIKSCGYTPQWIAIGSILEKNHRLVKVSGPTNYKIISADKDNTQVVIRELPSWVDIPWVEIQGTLEVCIDGNIYTQNINNVYDFVFDTTPSWDIIIGCIGYVGGQVNKLAAVLVTLTNAICDYDLVEESYPADNCKYFIDMVFSLGDIVMECQRSELARIASGVYDKK